MVSGAGATRPTFYLHFKTKAGLVQELAVDVRRRTGEFNDRLRAAVAAGDRESVRGYLDAAFSFWEEIREFAAAEEEAATLEPEIREARNRSFDQAVASIQAALAKLPAAIVPRIAVVQGWLACVFIGLLWLRRGSTRGRNFSHGPAPA